LVVFHENVINLH